MIRTSLDAILARAYDIGHDPAWWRWYQDN